MNGFIAGFSKSIDRFSICLEENEKCNFKQINNNYINIKVNSIKKFEKDKTLYENNRLIILSEGVLLNLKKLIIKYKCNNIEELIETMYTKNGETFFNEFRGSFCGILFDKKENITIIFTNQTGDRQVFYYFDNNILLVSSNIYNIIEFFKNNNINYNLNEEAAYELLTYGFMIRSNTLIDNIKKLQAGQYITLKNQINIKTYHQFTTSNIINLSETEIINKIDELFRKAVKMEFDKDIEYGYKHFANLSGGLDSRMVNWVARDLGYSNILNVTYCKNDYLDEIISKQISEDLKNEFLFKSLNDVSFIYDIEDVVLKNGGMSLYTGLTGGKKFFELLNFDIYGVDHTGQLGDVVIGTFCKNGTHNKPTEILGAFSSLLVNKLDTSYLGDYESEEIYELYSRGFTGCLNSHSLTQEFTEVTSPFMDIDLMEFCLSINPQIRLNHNLYFKWILSKYPEVAKYKWEKIDGKITTNKILLKIKRKIKNILSRIINENRTVLNMHPFDYWYYKNSNMRIFMDNYYKDNINYLDKYPILKQDVEKMYKEAPAREKTQVLTLLSAMKLFNIRVETLDTESI